MRYLLLSGLFFLSINSAFCQFTETKRIEAGEDAGKFLSDNGLFRFNTFTSGTYTMKNGSTAPALLNYNLFLGEMQYVSPQKQILSIANPQEFNFFKVGDVVFYFRDGYKEVIKDYNTYKLAVGIEITTEPEKVGAYGSAAGATKSTSLSSFQGLGGNFNGASIGTGGNLGELKTKENVLLTKKTTYYLLDKDKSAEIANKKNILKIFGSKGPVADYLKANSVNFNNRDELIKLLDFCMQQPK